jgi:hypothetical protein
VIGGGQGAMLQAKLGRWGVPWVRAQGKGTAVLPATGPVRPAGARHPEPDVGHPGSNVGHPGSNVGHPGSDVGVELGRLVAIVRLAPAQALALATDVLADLEERQAAGRECGIPPHGVRVGPDGRARLADDLPPDTGTSATGTSAGDLGGVATLLDDLGAATWPSAEGAELIGALERAAAEARLPQGRVAIVAAILRAADARHGAKARAELARLVSAASGEVTSVRRAPPTRPARPARPARPPTPPDPGRTRPAVRPVVRRTWRWTLSILVLVAVITVEIVFLREEIDRDVLAVLEAGRSGPSPTAGPTLPPVVPPAPAAAGTISSVGLRLVDRCAVGSRCALRTQVLLQPQAVPQPVAWAFRIVDRCTGAVTTAPGGTVALPPNADRADVVTAVPLPQTGALAVLAVTSLPSSAASPPVYVPADGACRR